MNTIVKVENFRKNYGIFRAVNDISFELVSGEILALLGPNGAGKTSTLECIEGVRRPDAGRIDVFGLDPIRDARSLTRRVGIQLQAQGLPPAMTVGEALGFFARYKGIKPDPVVSSRLGLDGKRREQIGNLSTGQQRRLALVLAVQHDPELVILDEPTAGLDVGTRDELHALMSELKSRGTTILLATHDMAEAEKLADRAIVLVGGRVAAEGSPRELTAGGAGLTRITVSTRDGTVVRRKPVFSGGIPAPFVAPSPEGASSPHDVRSIERSPSIDGDYAVYLCSAPARLLRDLLAWIESESDEIVDLRVERPTLEERYLEIVGRKS